jgi:hypothetical protein
MVLMAMKTAHWRDSARFGSTLNDAWSSGAPRPLVRVYDGRAEFARRRAALAFRPQIRN